jgi:hypothetical protein
MSVVWKLRNSIRNHIHTTSSLRPYKHGERLPRTLRVTLIGDLTMLWTIVAILLVLWVLGLATHVAGGLIHLLLVLAVIVVLVRLITGRRPV